MYKGSFSCGTTLIKTIFIVSLGITLLLNTGCTKSRDEPPKLDKPLPEPHSGVYESKDARLSFNGDGKTVTLVLSDRYLEILENPPNNSEYTYTFTWYDFGEYRYDAATNFRIYHSESKTYINFSLIEPASFENISITFPTPDKDIQILKRTSENP